MRGDNTRKIYPDWYRESKYVEEIGKSGNLLEGSLSHTTRNGSETSVNFAGRGTENEWDDGVSGNFDILEGSQDVDFP